MAQLIKCLLYTSMIAWVQVLGTTHGKSQAWGCLSVVPAAGRETGGSLGLAASSLAESVSSGFSERVFQKFRWQTVEEDT